MGIRPILFALFLFGFTFDVFGGTPQNDDIHNQHNGPNDSVWQNKRIEILEKENHAMKSSLKILQQKLDQIEAISNNRILTLEKELVNVNNFVTSTKERYHWQPIQGNRTNLNIGKRGVLSECHCAGKIAFSATMTLHQENLGIHQKVLFNHVITNVGNGFDPVTSIFKAPVSGTYFFTMVIMSHAGEDIETEIVKNNLLLVNAYSGDSTTWNEGSQSVVVNLDTGDDVFVRIVDNTHVNNGNIRIYGYSWSSFSGFLISK